MCCDMGVWWRLKAPNHKIEVYIFHLRNPLSFPVWSKILHSSTAEDRNPDKYDSAVGRCNIHYILHSAFMSLQRD